MRIKVKTVRDGARVPVRATPGAAGHDVYAMEDVAIKPGSLELVPTGVAFELPPGIEINVRPRSGLSKKGVVVIFGTVDPDYRGEVGVQLINLSSFPYYIRKGDRIAQIVFNQIVLPQLEESAELEDTVRGAGGFGSTGR